MEKTNPEYQLASSGYILPVAPSPLGVYQPCLIVGKFLYLSGHGPFLADGSLIKGRVGKELTLEDGKKAALQVGLSLLATMKAHLSNLNQVKRLVKLFGMVNCTTDFEKHPFVINGCSELFALLWGQEMGVGVRSAVGMASLPDNIPVEIEAMFELF
ncbi:MAG: RidA family protein [Flavisolibacter sp.]